MASRFNRSRRKNEAGYTILEVLIVLGIIALLAAVVAPRLIGYLGKAQSQTADLQIDNIASAVKLFRIDVGRYPTSAEGLQALMARPGDLPRWDGPYLEDAAALTDPWDRSYLYAQEGTAFSVRSLGADGVEGGEGEDSDLTNESGVLPE